MSDHRFGTREEWLAARLGLLEAEKALTRRSDEHEDAAGAPWGCSIERRSGATSLTSGGAVMTSTTASKGDRNART